MNMVFRLSGYGPVYSENQGNLNKKDKIDYLRGNEMLEFMTSIYNYQQNILVKKNNVEIVWIKFVMDLGFADF